ncbi:unnamed protein product [Adineta steineri]|uniref:RRM domain-containing protein n=1 Tax=Adineta steineri TaxID=433720 RepID=A0A815BPQ2_9BILA|nr:unnamed protein product [Adineta steineri]
MQVMIPNLPITSVVPTSFTNTYTCWNNNNAQVQYEPMELPNLQTTSDPVSSNMTLVDRMTNEYLSELNTQTSQPFMADIVYAFVVHRTHEKAQRNLRRPINRSLLGSQCRVEWNTHCPNFSINEQNIENRKIVIRGIPENVNENDLRDLFVNCHILKYCPARRIYSSTTTMETKGQNKILPG